MSNPAPGWRKYPQHVVKLVPYRGTVTVRSGDHLIAQSNEAIEVTESRHETVWYLPMAQVNAKLKSSDTETYCPFKGTANYHHVVTPDGLIEDAMWRYATPYDECIELKDYVSFYANKVSIAAVAE